MRATVMFSSWPVSALVAGLKIAGSSFALSSRPGGSFSPASVPCCGIFLPGRAREVAADHAFDREHRGAPAQHGAPGDRRRDGPVSAGTCADDLVGVGADHVMRHHAFELAEPPGADLGQHRALHRDGLGHHHVEGADAVGGRAAARGRRRRRRYRAPCRGRSVARADRWRASRSSVRLSKRRARATAQASRGREGDSSLRQRNELVFVGNVGKAAGLPVLLRLLDPLLAGGNEIPPDMARAFQRVAAEKHHPRRL